MPRLGGLHQAPSMNCWNPLNIISGHLQLMMMAEDLKQPWSDDLFSMKSALRPYCGHCQQSAEILLEARLERSLRLTSAEALRQLLEDVKARRPERPVAIEMSCEPGCPR